MQMPKKIQILLTISIVVLTLSAYAQKEENSGWIFLSHTQQITEKIKLQTDIQGRSSDRYQYWSNLLMRGAVSYGVSENGDAGLGYAYLGSWEDEDGGKVYSREHRIFEQYQHQLKFNRKILSLRGRLEQRFTKDEDIKFSQRLRAYASMQAPLIANKDFSRGLYLKLQDEIFFNVQHKENVNSSFFDQHRPYLALGYRISEHIDVELGYIRLTQKEYTGTVRRNIAQFMITTSL